MSTEKTNAKPKQNNQPDTEEQKVFPGTHIFDAIDSGLYDLAEAYLKRGHSTQLDVVIYAAQNDPLAIRSGGFVIAENQDGKKRHSSLGQVLPPGYKAIEQWERQHKGWVRRVFTGTLLTTITPEDLEQQASS